MASLESEHNLSPADISRIIEMAWEDRTPFEAIANQFAVDESQVIKIMRRHMSAGAFRRWRARVSGRKTKHADLRQPGVSRHQSSTHNKANR
ncbi:MAG: TIGR03643 family protein [Proteobacteria bacterium]|nr:TIGR03643 family protein [Pseudomonadota bacterium]